MRIDRIKFKNINSLKGEHEIQFGAEPLYSAGIFAIIGPTGSGKSTLLDVITLALYNRVPRIPKLITDTVVESTGTILTRFAKEASASIEYTTVDGSFISTWTIRKNRNDKLVSPHMELIDKKDGKPMDLKKSEVPVRNEELIGLNYNQFVKSIILSQGEFSKFLKADKNERGILLEKITGTGVYRSIGRRVYERFKTLEREIETAESKSEMITLFSEEELKEIKGQTNAAEKNNLQLEKQTAQLQLMKQTKELVHSFTVSAKQNAAQLAENTAVGKSLEKEMTTLAVHEKLSPFVAKISLHQEAESKAVLAQKEIATLQKNVETQEGSKKEVIQRMGDLINTPVSADDFMEKMKAFEAKVQKMDNDLKSWKDQANKIVAGIIQEAQNQSYTSAQSISLKKRGVEFQSIIDTRKVELKQYLKEVGLESTTSADSLIKLLNQTNEELEKKKEVYNKSLLHQTLTTESVRIKTQGEELAKQIKNLEPTLEKAQKGILIDKENLSKTRVLKEASHKRFSLNDARAALVEGEPCPLCGAEHHPHANSHEEKPSGFDEEIKKYEQLILATEKKIQEIDRSITTAKTEHKNALAKFKENESLRKENDKWFKENKVSVEKPDILQVKIDKLQTKSTNYSKGGSSLQEYQWLKATEKKVVEITHIGNEYAALSKERKSLCEKPDVVDLTNKLQNEFSGIASLISKNKGLLSKSEKDFASLQKQVTSISGDILPSLKKLGFANIASVKEQILSESKVSQIKTSKAQYEKRKIELETTKKTTDSELSKLSKQDDSKLSLEQVLVTLNTQTSERNKLLQQLGSWQNQLKTNETNKKNLGKLNKGLEKMKSALDNWALLNKMIGDQTGNKFANYAQNITLRHLLGLANKRLAHLFERYKLDMPKKEGELMIVDTYQGNIHRGVSTLSGGETFMISLALALSLSDMASKNVALESLFIDEGFSTLDPEMLDLAMTTLDKIQSESQKTVGIISHVESLKERIDVQIQLEKNAQGFSTLKISDGL